MDIFVWNELKNLNKIQLKNFSKLKNAHSHRKSSPEFKNVTPTSLSQKTKKLLENIDCLEEKSQVQQNILEAITLKVHLFPRLCAWAYSKHPEGVISAPKSTDRSY